MAKSYRHIIQKQVFELSLSSEKDAPAINQEVATFFKTEIIPKLSKVFDQLAGDQVIRINKLEIDIPPLSIKNWKSVFSKAIIDSIEAEMVKHISTNNLHNSGEGISNFNKKGTQGSLLDAFEYFCKKGLFPWWSSFTNFEDFETQLLNILTNNIVAVFKKLKINQVIVDRIIYQFSDKFFSSLVKANPNIYNHPINFKHWENLIQKGNFQSVSSSVVNHILKTVWLNQLLKASNNTTVDFNEFIFNVIDSIKKETVLDKIDIALKLFKSVKTYPNLKKERAIYLNTLESIIKDISNKIAPVQDIFPNQEKTTIEDSGIYIQNAGLVLLWPYLIRFFNNINLLEDNKFVSESAQQEAVLLLDYMISQNKQSREPELPLNKLLCAYPLWKTLPSQHEKIEKHKQQVDDLLLAVVKNWPALKTTSVDGFRENFLKREGKLEQLDKSWKLTVNRKSYDILLDKLPWSFRMIKLPWMEKMIQVEW